MSISCISLIRNKIIQNHPTSKASLSTSKVGWKSEIAGRRIKPLVASPNTGSHYNDQVRFIQNQGPSITRIGQLWNIRQQNASSKFISPSLILNLLDSLVGFLCRTIWHCTCLASTLGQEAQVLKENLHQFAELISRQASPSYNGQHSHLQWTWKLLILAVSNPSPWLSWPSHVNPHLKFFIWGRPQARICSKRPFDSTTRRFGWGHQHADDLQSSVLPPKFRCNARRTSFPATPPLCKRPLRRKYPEADGTTSEKYSTEIYWNQLECYMVGVLIWLQNFDDDIGGNCWSDAVGISKKVHSWNCITFLKCVYSLRPNDIVESSYMIWVVPWFWRF